MLTIGIDMMGGDNAPAVTQEGLKLALPALQAQTQVALIGPGSLLDNLEPTERKRCIIIEAQQTIEMAEHAVRALQAKPDNTISVGYKALKAQKINAFASAGHSGAMMVGAMHILGMANGITRPVVATPVPTPSGRTNLLLDVGINADCKAEQLLEFARLGSAYAQEVYQKPSPKVALLNTGSEPGKGNLLYQRAHQLLSECEGLNFVGNLEARDFFTTEVDVTICDGFTGNIVLKQMEAFYQLLETRKINDSFLNKLNYEQYGGTPVLGVQGNVILGHGASSATAIKNMILAAESVALANFANHVTSI